MTTAQFGRSLGLTTLVGGLLTASLHAFPRLTIHWPMTVVGLVFFCTITLLGYVLARRTAAARNKHLFTNAVLGFTMLKMLLCGGVVVVYVLLAEPTDRLFVLPFFLLYLIYTPFEVYVFTKMARKTPPQVDSSLPPP